MVSVSLLLSEQRAYSYCDDVPGLLTENHTALPSDSLRILSVSRDMMRIISSVTAGYRLTKLKSAWPSVADVTVQNKISLSQVTP